MSNVTVEQFSNTPVDEQITELVERKGTGHPDSICDGIAEEISISLAKEYEKSVGHILHHNIDKSLLVAGHSKPKIGGGSITKPMKLVIGDNAVAFYKDLVIPVEEIAIRSAKNWIKKNLRNIDPESHIEFQNEIQEGSVDLIDNFEREKIGANDTSAAVGYAPLTETEQMVYKLENYLNSEEIKKEFPCVGEDIKIMGFRHKDILQITIGMAFVDRFIANIPEYFAKKEAVRQKALAFLNPLRKKIKEIKIDINTLDDEKRGESGMYLTVLGTSAESGDCGQVGRGNRVNGLIALNRPMSTEAAAGKNAVSHVGKIYNVLSHKLADEIYQNVPGIHEVYVWLCSQIGKPIEEPLIASAQIIPNKEVDFVKVKSAAEEVMQNRLQHIYEFTKELAEGKYLVW